MVLPIVLAFLVVSTLLIAFYSTAHWLRTAQKGPSFGFDETSLAIVSLMGVIYILPVTLVALVGNAFWLTKQKSDVQNGSIDPFGKN